MTTIHVTNLVRSSPAPTMPTGAMQPVFVPAGTAPPTGLVPAGAVWYPPQTQQSNSAAKFGNAPILPEKKTTAKEGETTWTVFGK